MGRVSERVRSQVDCCSGVRHTKQRPYGTMGCDHRRFVAAFSASERHREAKANPLVELVAEADGTRGAFVLISR